MTKKHWVGCSVALLLACNADRYITGPALLEIGRGELIAAPDSARVGIPVEVILKARGSIAVECNRPAGVNVQQLGDVTRMEVFHRRPSANVVCPAVPRDYLDTVSLRFSAPGVKTLRLIGTALYVGPGTPLDSVQRFITVVP